MGRWCFGARSLPSALRPRDSERQCRASGMLLSEGSLYYACRLLTSPSAPRDDRGSGVRDGKIEFLLASLVREDKGGAVLGMTEEGTLRLAGMSS